MTDEPKTAAKRIQAAAKESGLIAAMLVVLQEISKMHEDPDLADLRHQGECLLCMTAERLLLAMESRLTGALPGIKGVLARASMGDLVQKHH